MLTLATKGFLPAVVRAQLASPSTYPALSQAFSSITSMKKPRHVYKIIHAPRPKPELQSWNVHGTIQSAAPGTVKPTMMQMQSWNHHDPISELAGHGMPEAVSDLLTKAIEMEFVNEEAQNEIVASTGRMQASPKTQPRRKLSHPYYPQYASDLANEAYEMDHQDEQTVAKAPTSSRAAAPSTKPSMSTVGAPFYPQYATDLATEAYEMEHPEEKTGGQ